MTLVVAGVVALALLASPSADTATVVERFLTREDTPLHSYRASRHMTARNPRFNKEGWADVRTAFGPDGFTYEVLASGGSSLVINRVLLPALKSEAEMWRSGEPARYGLTRQNYEFSAAAPEETAVRVPIRALNKHILLINGSLLLSPADGDLLRVEGRLSKSPSFWVSRVEVVRHYARLAGVRVPVELESVAFVRLAGRSEMRITYSYESINGLPLEQAGKT
jgi:hypothetical protein